MKFKLGELQSFDKSPIWTIHDKYYQENGKNSWKNGHIPFNITSNSRFAYQNAKIFFEAVKNSSLEKLYILEMGAGSGIFAYYFLEQLKIICEQEKSDLFDKVHYMITDYSVTNLNDIKNSKVFDDYQLNNTVGFYLYDINYPKDIKSLDNIDFELKYPLSGVFANYFYCVLPYKIIKREKDDYYELNVQTFSKDISYNEILNNTTEKEYQDKIEIDSEYLKIDVNKTIGKDNIKVLLDLVEKKNNFTFDYPLLSVNSIKEITSLLDDKGILVISDKAFNSIDDYFSRPIDKISHYNSISYTANYPLFINIAKAIGYSTYISNLEYIFKTLVITKNDSSNLKTEFYKLFKEKNINVEIIEEYKKGHNLLKKGNIIEAISIFENCYSLLPNDEWLIYTLASAYLANFEIEKSLKYSEKGYELDKFKFFDFSLIIGFCFLNMGNYQKSKEFLNQSINDHGNKEENGKALALCNKLLMAS